VGAAPEHDEVIQQIGALAHDDSSPTLDGLERDLASLLDDLLRRSATA
jgi:hypothetical protein